jgi:phosphatidylinositol 4-kinase
MHDITTFLVRWFYLANLARNLNSEILKCPSNPYHHQEQLATLHLPKHHQEEIWRKQCILEILNYPPGAQRVIVMDSLRVELVQRLSHLLQDSDHALSQLRQAETQQNEATHNTDIRRIREDDPFLDSDVEILRHFGDSQAEGEKQVEYQGVSHRKAKLILSQEGTNFEDDSETSDPETVCKRESAPAGPMPTPTHIRQAICCARDIRDYLPQLVAAVLKTPPALEPRLADPIQRLRRLILRRCQLDPSWGVELCWLLEAEVGRAWKTLFEHRQQTGRRLIVVLPAEKVAVLAKIGNERREAFDLLQDTEQATAYGYVADDIDEGIVDYEMEKDPNTGHPRLPSSLSLRRCSHFGDSMHLIDRLTKVSLDLRQVPLQKRTAVLHDSLSELNRRLRRRMVTRADVSLDVEDYRSPYDWPLLEDMSVDMLQYSVYFPLVPQSGAWPDGTEKSIHTAGKSENSARTLKAVRCLNIVVPETRILASRERCPYLVQMEVADTNLESGDARIYASGAVGLGSTMEEALGMTAAAASAAATRRQNFVIPPELLHRGGWQQHGAPSYIDRGDGVGMYADHFETDPYDSFRQHDYEQLHQLMHSQPTPPPPPTEHMPYNAVSVGLDLLDNVFGQPWAERCREIRENSPFGHVQGWRLASFIMKAGEDIRREALVMQVISKLLSWFTEEIPEEHRPYMRPYTIMCVGGDAGLLECLSDAKSVDEVKKKVNGFTSLREYFERAYGPPSYRRSGFGPPSSHDKSTGVGGSLSFETAQDNFLRSLVGYSLVCYILQIKDRHNANILLDREGHIMHIDFGFVLGDTPKMGKVPIFSERAPFKLSQEFWEVLGGWNTHTGGLGVRFCKMFELAFECASAHSEEIATLVEATMLSLNSNPTSAQSIADAVRSRLKMHGPPRSAVQKHFIMNLVNAALTCWSTSTYDWLQKSMNGYL